jgi:DNA-binding beta-propeller fold protein YncE
MDIIWIIKRCSLPVAGIVALLFCLAMPGQIRAADAPSPWKLVFTLSDKSLNDALPTALYVDGDKKRYYMVDSAGGRLASFDDQGAFQKTFSPEDGLLKPFDMVRLDESVLVVVEKGKNSLTRIDFASKETTRVVVKDQGRQLMVDRLESSAGILYVLDRATGQIYRLSDSFKIEQRFPLPENSGGIVDFKIVDKQIWAVGQQEKTLYVYSDNGLITKRIDISDLVKFPVSLALDSGGLVYILDRHQGEVVVLDRKAKLKYRFLDKGHGPQSLYYPMEILFDPWGRLCVVDEGNNRVQVFGR